MEGCSAYDSLLEKLGCTTRKSLVDRPEKKRKREDKKAPDFDEEGDCRSKLAKSGGTDDGEVDDSDVVKDVLERLGCTSSSQCESIFESHMEHKLSEEDIEKLLKGSELIWKLNMPSPGSKNRTLKGSGDNFLKGVVATAPYGLKENLYKHWLEVYESKRGKNFPSSQQRLFFSLCNSYRDILHSNQEAFYEKRTDKASCYMDAYIMHSLNHVLKSRDLVMKNNAKLANIDAISGDGFCDQGFTRAKVLILLPLASVALCLVKRLIQLTPSSNKVNVEYMDRFIKEFGFNMEKVEDEREAKKLHGEASKHLNLEAFFGGKNYDNFVVGVKFTRKSMRLYSDFDSSDMIIASPLGLESHIAKKQVDYLSSIEILIVDHADIMLMQNWAHVINVVTHLNCLPSKPTKTDIGRIRHWSWNAQYYRQTIILASYLNPDIQGLFNKQCLNFEGKLLLSCEYKGVMSKIPMNVQQVYRRFHITSTEEADGERLDYFVTEILPTIERESNQGGIMLFISSYLEYIRIAKLFLDRNVSFCSLPETKREWKDTSCARNWFLQGHSKIRGIRKLYIYSLPERAETYSEILNMLERSETMTCTVLFTKDDQLRLERIVGTKMVKEIAKSENDIFIVKQESPSKLV